MNKISLYVIAFILCFAVPRGYSQQNNGVNVPARQAGDVFYHTVEAGQTVYAIATMYGVSVDDIYRLNPSSKETIRTGQKLMIPQKKETAAPTTAVAGGTDYIYHTIEPKETLYSLSTRYKVSAEEIVRANPGLSVKTLIIGKTIRIPNVPAEDKIIETVKVVNKDTKYVVKKNDTFYSIGRRFDISQQELIRRNPSLKNGLKAGATIFIPEKIEVVVSTTTQAPRESEVNALLNTPERIQRVNVAKVALLLPFQADEALTANSSRFLEYYEGFLLAVDSLRKQGYSIDLHVYDTGNGTKKIKEILNQEVLKDVNLIIGAVQNDQIKLVADFAEKHHIRYVIPFTSKNDDVLNNAALFQVNTPHSYLYAKATQAVVKLFRDYNIMLLDCPGDKEVKTDFIKTLKMELKNRGIPFSEYTCDENFALHVDSLLSIDIPNVIIPTSGSAEALMKILPPLRQVVETTTDYRISLFGYPEWQTYTKDYLEDFYALNTYIYSSFYADNLSPEVKKFYQDYKTWYGKSPVNIFPKYGMLGFDTAMFFIDALHNYGENFENSLPKMRYNGIQTMFDFERVNNWGGFINTNLFIVHYKNNFTVNRTESDRL